MAFHNFPELLFFIVIRDLSVSGVHVSAWYQSSLFFRIKKTHNFLLAITSVLHYTVHTICGHRVVDWGIIGALVRYFCQEPRMTLYILYMYVQKTDPVKKYNLKIAKTFLGFFPLNFFRNKVKVTTSTNESLDILKYRILIVNYSACISVLYMSPTNFLQKHKTYLIVIFRKYLDTSKNVFCDPLLSPIAMHKLVFDKSLQNWLTVSRYFYLDDRKKASTPHEAKF